MEGYAMKQKSSAVISVSLIAAMTMAVYLFGVQHGRSGESLGVINEAVAAD